MGTLYFVHLHTKLTSAVREELSDKYEYVYEADGEDIVDPYAAGISGRDRWNGPNKMPQRSYLFERILTGKELHSAQALIRLVLYQLHVRGFTKHASSGVSKPALSQVCRTRFYILKVGSMWYLLPVCGLKEKQVMSQ